MRLRVVRLESIDVRGEATTERAVFCPARRCSMPLDECRSCVHFRRADDAVIECTPGGCERPEVPADGVLGTDVRVGEVMGESTVLIPVHIPVRVAIEFLTLRASGHALVGIVVEPDGSVIGTLEHAEVGPVDEIESASQLARAVPPIEESAPLAAAIERMVKERRRFLPVVGEGGRVVGLLSDLDALHWIASRRSHLGGA